MSQLRTIRAFSTEVMKIAARLDQDGDIQKLLANRKGEEYLQGGKLPSNSIADEQEKTAYYSAPVGMSASGNYDHTAKKKKHNKYQKGRDYAGAAIRGGLTGLGILGGMNAMRGRFGAPITPAAVRSAALSAQRAATAGAGIAVADRAYRHDDVPGFDKKAALVTPGLSDGFKSPAESLAASQQTGGFKPVMHQTGKAPRSLQLGKKFRLP